jgi:predicted ribosomally synthesized peptide with SipW-like signal peptide
MFGKKRLLIAASGLTALGAAGAMVAGVTFGLFSSTPTSESNSFTAGTVTLSSDATGVCTIPTLVPGDSGTCTFVATYSGNVPAFVGLDTASTGALLAGTTPLSITITDQTTAVYANTGTNLFVASDSAAPTNTVHTFTVTWSMPLTAGNSYEGETAQVVLTAHAVQSAHNGSSSGCAAGSACPGILLWS